MQNVPAAVYATHWGHAGVYHSISWDLTLVWWDLVGSRLNLGLFLVGFDGIHTRSGAIWWDLVGSTVYLVLSSGILTQSGAIW